MPEGIDEVGVTFAWAVAPADGEDGDSLLQPRRPAACSARKRAAKAPASATTTLP